MFQIDQTIYKGAPPAKGRLEKEMRTYALLEELGIPFERADHDEAATIDDCLAVDELLGIHMCKNLFLCNQQKTCFYLLLMPGDKKFRTSDFSKQLSIARTSFAGSEFMEKYLDITPGSVSVLGLMNDKKKEVRLIIDKDLKTDKYLGCHPCINTSSLKILMTDITDKFLKYTGHRVTYVKL